MKWCAYKSYPYALRIENTSESDPRSYEATKAVAKKVQKKINIFIIANSFVHVIFFTLQGSRDCAKTSDKYGEVWTAGTLLGWDIKISQY